MEALFDVNTFGSDTCDRGPNWELFIHCCLAPSLVIVLTLSFFAKRYNVRRRSLFGIKQFAVPHPINLLDDHVHRWSHALAFGTTATIILELFSGFYINMYMSNVENIAPWVKILLGAVATIELGTVLYPFFACISAPTVFVGSLLGFLYSAVWFSVLMSVVISCPNLDGPGFAYEYLITQIPVLIFTFLLMIRFLYYLIKSIMARIRNTKMTSEEKLMKSYQAQHVKALLRPPVKSEYKTKWERRVYRWYEPTKNFIYPTRIICTFVVAVLCQYQIAIQLTYSGGVGIDYAGEQIHQIYAAYAITYNISEAEANYTQKSIAQYITAGRVSWYAACPLSILVSLLYIGHIFVCYRKHILRMYQGNRKFLPDGQLGSAKSMTGSLQYCGFQIAYYLSGYVIMMIMFALVIFVVSGGVVIPLVNNALNWIRGFLNTVVPLLGVVMLVFASQPILVKYVFLQPKLKPDDKEKPLALQHRDFYHNFSYFLVFLNVLVGMASCVIRILTGMIVGVFLLGRIDRPILMRGFESLDQSYQAYIGNLHMVNAHSHPVLVVFCQLLINKIVVRKRARLARTPAGSLDATASYSFVEHDYEGVTAHARAVMRWQLAYTLLYNPRLLHLRKRSRQLTFQELQNRISRLTTLLPHRQQVMQRSQSAGQLPLGAARIVRHEENMETIESLKRELTEKRVEEEEEEERSDKGVVRDDDDDEMLDIEMPLTGDDVTRVQNNGAGDDNNGTCEKNNDNINSNNDHVHDCLHEDDRDHDHHYRDQNHDHNDACAHEHNDDLNDNSRDFGQDASKTTDGDGGSSAHGSGRNDDGDDDGDNEEGPIGSYGSNDVVIRLEDVQQSTANKNNENNVITDSDPTIN